MQLGIDRNPEKEKENMEVSEQCSCILELCLSWGES